MKPGICQTNVSTLFRERLQAAQDNNDCTVCGTTIGPEARFHSLQHDKRRQQNEQVDEAAIVIL